jgi:hypothetical protein
MLYEQSMEPLSCMLERGFRVSETAAVGNGMVKDPRFYMYNRKMFVSRFCSALLYTHSLTTVTVFRLGAGLQDL